MVIFNIDRHLISILELWGKTKLYARRELGYQGGGKADEDHHTTMGLEKALLMLSRWNFGHHFAWNLSLTRLLSNCDHFNYYSARSDKPLL